MLSPVVLGSPVSSAYGFTMRCTFGPLLLVTTLALAACGGSNGVSEQDDPQQANDELDELDDETAPESGDEGLDDDDVESGVDESSGEVAEVGPFDIDGDTAFMVDEIGSDTPDAVRTLLSDYSDVTTISLVNVGGSSDDQANLEASRLVREAGLATHVPADGEIASGGVDFFLAGATRSFDDGARFGVHSWAGDDIEGADLPEDDPEHDLYLDYYAEMGVDADFYWFTLEAAPAADIHWMTSDELDTYDFAIAG